MYSKVARFNAVQYGRDGKPNVAVNAGSGFFYSCENQAYFVTDRNCVIIEEKAFLPDSIIIYQNSIEQQRGVPSAEGMKVPLYDKNEKPVWKVLSWPVQDESRVPISVPITQGIAQGRVVPEASFLATRQLPKEVYLNTAGDDGKDVSLSIPVAIGLSLADYFLYSEKSNEKELQRKIEKPYGHAYRDYNHNEVDQVIEVNFNIRRKGFAKDMVEMVLVLLEQNMDRFKELRDRQNLPDSVQEPSPESRGGIRKESKDISELLQTHSKLMEELEKIMGQFHDVLAPSIFDRIETMFKIMMTKQNRLAGLSPLLKNEADYIIVKHLIHKILEQLGRNIVFTQ